MQGDRRVRDSMAWVIEDDPVELIGYADNLALLGLSRISRNKDPSNIQTRWHLLAQPHTRAFA